VKPVRCARGAKHRAARRRAQQKHCEVPRHAESAGAPLRRLCARAAPAAACSGVRLRPPSRHERGVRRCYGAMARSAGRSTRSGGRRFLYLNSWRGKKKAPSNTRRPPPERVSRLGRARKRYRRRHGVRAAGRDWCVRRTRPHSAAVLLCVCLTRRLAAHSAGRAWPA
jgi:hypothetical protein